MIFPSDVGVGKWFNEPVPLHLKVLKCKIDAPLMTFPLAVFLKNLRCVITASSNGRFRIVIAASIPGDEVCGESEG